MEIIFDKIEIRQKVVKITISDRLNNYLSNDAKLDSMTLSLLLGAYNPMRKFSPTDKPIDLKVLEKYQNRFINLLYEMRKHVDVKPPK